MAHIIFENGDEYEGSFDPDLIHGKMKYKNGDVYEGSFSETVKHGFGKLECANGDVFEGEWNNNVFNGNGTIKFKNGRIISYYKQIKSPENMILISENNKNYLQITKNNKILYSSELPEQFKTFEDLKFLESEFIIETESLSSDDIERITCPVSLSVMYDPIVTSCNHTFCKKSIEKWNNTCCICRQNVLYYLPNFEILNVLKKSKYKLNDKEYNLDEYKILDQIKILLEENSFLKKKVKNEDKKKSTKKSKKDESDYEDEPKEKPKKDYKCDEKKTKKTTDKKKADWNYCGACDASDSDDCECPQALKRLCYK
jgi:hypothetical protein